ncbi:hypothetical protein SPFM9_00147 [Salmonella phage SPFM9]|nr:hypothetical protein SPFM9_00147 [Salmonella phage SPFM9]
MAIIKTGATAQPEQIALQGARYMGIITAADVELLNEVVPLKFAYVGYDWTELQKQFTTDWAYNRASAIIAPFVVASKPQAEYVAYRLRFAKFFPNLADVVTDVDLESWLIDVTIKPGCLAWQGGLKYGLSLVADDIVDQSVKDLGPVVVADPVNKLSELLPFLNAGNVTLEYDRIEMEILFRNVMPGADRNTRVLLYGLNGKGYKTANPLTWEQVATGFPESVQTIYDKPSKEMLLDAINRQNGFVRTSRAASTYTLTTRRV